jgi:hypothetical protein
MLRLFFRSAFSKFCECTEFFSVFDNYVYTDNTVSLSAVRNYPLIKTVCRMTLSFMEPLNGHYVQYFKQCVHYVPNWATSNE